MIIGLFAVDRNNGMGLNGHMPWPHNKDDMRWFKSTTQKQIVAMGRKTWDSPDMPSPLPGRLNVLFTNTFIERDDIQQVRGDVCEALLNIQSQNLDKNIYVIGGPGILMQSLPVLEKAFVTRIHEEYLSDVTIDLDLFLKDFTLNQNIHIGTCHVEEYINEGISKRISTYFNQRQN